MNFLICDSLDSAAIESAAYDKLSERWFEVPGEFREISGKAAPAGRPQSVEFQSERADDRHPARDFPLDEAPRRLGLGSRLEEELPQFNIRKHVTAGLNGLLDNPGVRAGASP